MALVYLTFFNGRRTWREALSLDATGIIKLFQSFADDQNNIYEVHDGAHAYIEKAVEKIRTVHERYLGNPHQNPGYIVGNPNFIEVGYLGNIFKLRTLYDIVGWIFSVVGNVPVRATRENYYYPLMMIAYVFCSKLAPALPRHSLPISRAPDVWVVWWFQQTVENRPVTRVVLGATLDKPGKDVTGKNVKDETKDLRKYWLKEAGLLKDGTTVPMQMMKSWGMSGQDFGHCAETYPLLFICSLAKDRSEAFEIRGSTEGISARASNLYVSPPPGVPGPGAIRPFRVGGVHNGEVNPNILRPCHNCGYIIVRNGFSSPNFEEGL